MLRLCGIWLRGLALLVPPEGRAEWLEEWETELACRWQGLGSRPGAARLAGRLRNGGMLAVEAAGAAADAVWLWREEWSLDVTMNDLRSSLRALARRPLFTLVAILTLAAGIGAVTAIYSLVDAVLLRPLPYPAPERLVVLWEKNPERGWYQQTAAPANFLDWGEQASSFDGVAATMFRPWSQSLSGDGEPQPVRIQTTTANLFDVLGVAPLHGRGFAPGATWSGGESTAVLGYRLWQERFGGDPGVVGRTIRLDQESVTVVGVMPQGFSYPAPGIDVWVPFGWDPAAREETWFRRAHFVRVIARLAPGVTVAAAQQELETVAARLERAYPETNEQMGAGLTPLHEWTVGDVETALWLLLGAVALVLLIVCANVVHLLLVRAGARQQEMAVRSALGAGRRRLVALLAVENLVLAAAAGVVGAVLGQWGLRALVALSPSDLPRLAEVTLDARVYLVALGVTLVTLVGFGLLPAVTGSRVALRAGLGSRARGASSSRGQRRMRRMLVVAEVAVALLLVAGSGLLIKSLYRLSRVDPGFDPERLVAAKLTLPEATYPEDAQVQAFYDEIVARAAALPGVEAVSTASDVPFLASPWTSSFAVAGRGREEFGIEVEHADAGPGFFRALGVPLVAGRDFTGFDRADAPPVVIVNETLARAYFPTSDPVGQRLAFDRYPDESSTWYTVVGVVGDVHLSGLRSEVRPLIYQPVAQRNGRTRELVVRTAGDPRFVVPRLAELVRSLDDELPVMRATVLADALSESLARERFVTLLLTSFGTLALLLAALGTYGVMAIAVHQRTREIGIRMALGASTGEVVGQVVREGMGMVLTGLVLGLLGALALARYLGALLYDVSPVDATTHAAAALLFLAAGLLASLLPARRAARVDPTTTLRSE